MKVPKFKKINLWLITAITLLVLIPALALTASAADSLTDTATGVTLTPDADGYYQIGTADELSAFSNLVNAGNTAINGILTADITLNEDLLSKLTIQTGGYEYQTGTATVKTGNTVASWTPIGSKDAPYTGIFNGNGKTISGLYFNENNETNGKYSGVFRSVSGGKVKDLKLSDSYIYGYWWVGGIVGLAINSEISGCSVEGGWVMSNNAYIGAIVGKAEGSCKISDCSSNCFINGSSYTGGIVGALIGTATNTGLISNCTNTSTFYDLGRHSGGIAGEVQYGTVDNCTNTSALSSSEGNLGGIVGSFTWSATVRNCHNKGDISSTSRGYVGGVAGKGEFSVSMIKCSNTGSVSATDDWVGGVIGYAYDADITNCYSVGSVSGADDVGGVVGILTSSGNLTGCYSSGTVTGTTNVGGIVGQVALGSTVEDNTYDLTKHTGEMFGSTYSTTANILENNVGYSTADYTSGKVCYIMNGSTSEGELVWGQTIGSENTPNFTGRTVYYDEYTVPQYWNDRPETKYTVSFEANGGSGTMASTEVAASTNYALPECGFTAPEGKEFKAWSVDGAEYAVGDEIFITGATTVSAVWKDKTVVLYSVAVTSSDNGSVKADVVSAAANSTVTLTITPDTYYQIGDISITDANGGTVQLNGSTFTMPASDVTVTVSFERIQYQVSFASNGGSGSMSAVMVNAGEEYTLPSCTFTAPYGKMFKAWQIDGDEYAVGDEISLSAAVTVTAVWKNIPEAMWGASADSLTGGGTLTEALNAAKKDSSIKYIKLTKGVTGSFSAQGGEFVLDLNGNTITAEEMTYYVAFDVASNAVITMKNGTVYAPTSSYSDPLNVNGKLKLENVALSGSSDMNLNASIGFGGTVDLSGYTDFSGITVCYTSENGVLILPEGYAVMSGSTVVTEPKSGVIYTIGLAPVVTTITFDTNGGSEIAAITQDPGTAVTKPQDPTKDGCTFMGWDTEIPATMPEENITVKAQWYINSVSLSFTEPAVGAKATEMTIPANAPYTATTEWEGINAGDTFALGESYMLTVTVEPSNDHFFSDATVFTVNEAEFNGTVEINESQIYIENEYYYVEYIDEIDLSVNAADGTVIPAFGVPDGAKYSVSYEEWRDYDSLAYLDDGDKLSAGHAYIAYVEFMADAGYEFADDAVFKVNGVTKTGAEISASNGNYSYMISIYIPIEAVALTVDVPKYGESAPTVSAEANANYTINYTKWLDANSNPLDSGFTFDAGKYTLVVDLKPAAGYKFTDTTKITVNGNDVDSSNLFSDNAEAFYEFEIAGPVASVTVDGETTSYTDLDVAVSAAASATGESITLTLLDHILRDSTVTIKSGKFTIDLNGKILTSSSHGFVVQNTGTQITFKGTTTGSAVKSTGAACAAIYIDDGAEVIIEGGSYESTYMAVDAYAGTELKINGGTFHGSRTAINSSGNLTISGGTFSADGTFTLAVSGTAKITGGKIEKGSRAHISYWGGSLDLSEYADVKELTVYNNVSDATVSGSGTNNITLPTGYALYDDNGQAATTLASGTIYTVGEVQVLIPTIDFLTFDGYQVRMDSYNGLRSRFVADLNKLPTLADDGYEVIEYGTVMAASDKLTANSAELTVSGADGVYSTLSYAKMIPIFKNGANMNKYKLNSETNILTYYCTVTNNTVNTYDKSVTIRGYAIVRDSAGNEYVLYVDYADEDYRSVSLETICDGLAADGSITAETCISYADVLRFRDQKYGDYENNASDIVG